MLYNKIKQPDKKKMTFFLDPNIAYFLLVLGLVAALLAIITPTTGYLEITALVLLVAAGYSIYNLSTNPWSLAALLAGVVLLAFSLRKPKPWLFLGLAVVFLGVGSIFLFLTPQGRPAVNPLLAISMSAAATGLTWLIGRRTIEAINHRPAHDLNQLIGESGEALTDIRGSGSVYVGSEEWSARADTFIPAGSRVRITARDGLILRVEPEENNPDHTNP